MNIITFGASGDVGRRVVAEALAREHGVTAVVRRETKGQALPASAAVCVADALHTERIAELMAGHDLAISALRPPDGQEEMLVALTRSVLRAAGRSGLPIIVVGGAASLMLPDRNGHTVLSAPGFLPEAVLPIAKACQAQYDLIATERHVDWSYLCPPALLRPGIRTGRYRLGSDVLLVDADGGSAISMEDFAVALIDEAETPRHRRSRFTVAHAHQPNRDHATAA